MRQQAELLRGQPGIPQSQIDLMLRAAEQAEAERPPAVPPRLVQNLDVLTRTTPRLDSEERRRLTGMAAGAVSAPLFRLDSASLEATLDSLHALHVRAGERAAPGGG